MNSQPSLTGQRILIVEDDYYIATDTARALEGAGATVIGPCPTEAIARDEILGAPPTAAVLDINLRGGRSFELARELKSHGTPFIFITGYDQDVIPSEFEDVQRLLKPAEFKQIVRALAQTLGLEVN